MEELVPTEADIEWAVKWLRNHRSRGPSGMRADNLKGWLAEARKEEAEAAKAAGADGTGAVIGEPGGEEMAEKTET